VETKHPLARGVGADAPSNLPAVDLLPRSAREEIECVPPPSPSRGGGPARGAATEGASGRAVSRAAGSRPPRKDA
jgi:hypothetical protein